MTVTPTDKFIVNRDDQVQTVEQQALMATLQNDDLLLVNRADVTHTITGEDLIDSLIDELIISKPLLSTANPAVGVSITASASASGGKGPYAYVYQWLKTGDVEILGATAASYIPVVADAGETLACRVTATDSQPESAVGTSDYSNAVIVPASKPVIGAIALAADAPGGDRFTNKSFTTSIVMTDDGIPSSDKELKAEVQGALSIAGATDEITNIADGPSLPFSAITSPGGVIPDSWVESLARNLPKAFSGIDPLAPDDAGIVYLYSSRNQNPTIYTFTFAVPLTYTTKAEIWLGPDRAYTINGNAVTVTGSQQWADITTQGGNSISTFEIQITSGNSADYYPVFGSIKLDGVYYTTGGTILTLASDANLANGVFVAGDVVKQNNSPIFAISSPIVNVVSQEDVGAISIECMSGSPTSPFTVGGPPVYVFNSNTQSQPVTNGIRIKVGDTVKLYCNPESGTDKFNVITTGGNISFSIQSQSGSWNGATGSDVTVSTVDGIWTGLARASGTTNCGFTRIDINGEQVVAGGILGETVLTLQDFENLNEFEVGDVVQGDGGDEVFVSSDFSIQPVWADTPQGGTWTNYTAATTVTAVSGLTDPAIAIGVWQSNDQVNWTRIDNFGINDLPRIIYSGDSYTYMRFGGPAPNCSITLSDGSLVDKPIKITAIDANIPSISTDGGRWLGTDTAGSRYEPSQLWSDNSIGSFDPAYPATNAFDGSETTSCSGLFVNGAYSRIGFNFDPPLSGTTVFLCGVTVDAHLQIWINGSNPSAADVVQNPDGSLTNLVTTTEIVNKYETTGPGLRMVTNDGKPLIEGEKFVTGPPTYITATYVSADPAVPSMTVSDVVGPWSANTGNYAVNTIVNPINIKPETSAITSINSETNNYSQYGEGTMYSGNGWDKAFDGVITNSTDVASNSVGTAVWTPATPIPFSGTVTLYLLNEQSNKCLINGLDIYVLTGIPAGGYNTPVSCSAAQLGGFLQSISLIRDGTGAYLGGVEVDGALLIDGATSTTLTLTDDTDLNQFVAGDEIYANEAAKLETSLIKSVADLSWCSKSTLSGGDWSTTGPCSNMFDGKVDTAALSTQKGAVLTIDLGEIYTGSLKFYNYTSIGTIKCYNGSNETGTLDFGSSKKWVTITDNATFDSIKFFADPNTSFVSVAAWEINGNILADGSILTLTDDTDLAKFRVGDVVQKELGNSPVFFTEAVPDATNDLTSSELVVVADAELLLNTTEQSVGNQPSGYGNSHLVLDLINSEASFTFITTDSWTVNTSTNGKTWVKENASTIFGATDVRTWLKANRPATASSRYIAISWASDGSEWQSTYDIKIQFNQAYIDAYISPHSPSELPTLGTEVSITAISEATPSITTDGGSWLGSNGSGDTGDGRYEPSQQWSDSLSGAALVTPQGMFDGDVTSTWAENTANGQTCTLTFTPPIDANKIEILAYMSSGSVTISSNDGSQSTTSRPGSDNLWTASLTVTSGQVSTVSWSAIGGGSGGTYTGMRVDNKLLVNSSIPGGAGETTVETTVVAATGEVSAVDVAGLTMTVADTTSRWITGTKVTMDPKPAVAVNAFLKFDSNGIVTGYQTADPGYVNMGLGLSKTLTFPAIFNSGEAPDTELPEGTTIRTRVNAVNPEGSSQSAYSNSIKPGTTRLLAMGETEYTVDQYAAIATRIQGYLVRETENECVIAQASYDAELAAFTARIEEIRTTYGTEETEETSGGY